jgi:hypothetical protein
LNREGREEREERQKEGRIEPRRPRRARRTAEDLLILAPVAAGRFSSTSQHHRAASYAPAVVRRSSLSGCPASRASRASRFKKLSGCPGFALVARFAVQKAVRRCGYSSSLNATRSMRRFMRESRGTSIIRGAHLVERGYGDVVPRAIAAAMM